MRSEAIRTVLEGASIEFTVRGSRFIGLVTSASNHETAEQIIEEVSDEHPDATHIVWAYRLADEPTIERCDDAGEPGGSAGEPVLSVLKSEQLLNVVAIVVRYYGGTNLGYGGLVRAYSRSVSHALKAAAIQTTVRTIRYHITTSYDDSGTVASVLESEDLEYEAVYEERVNYDVLIPVAKENRVLDRLKSATSGRVEVER